MKKLSNVESIGVTGVQVVIDETRSACAWSIMIAGPANPAASLMWRASSTRAKSGGRKLVPGASNRELSYDDQLLL
jgi:hypothetical protein